MARVWNNQVAHLRTVCLALPEAVEKPFGGHTAPSFRVRDKMFAMVYEDLSAMVCKAPPGEQQALVAADPHRYFVPAYVGNKGWVGVRLDGADADELTELVEESYRLIAPRTLAKSLDTGRA